ncbi:RiPP maturation radical SAM C-methyltransferase [Paraburkholderia sabiae]|uniref:RiPP maturation radical SAM C-methyltransferase n=1 Tax=Paraburkholderia sabiae TaxID=273251 RepID=A0ABU9QLT9_9BURK|nr:RiPP maturation radical SAM C-methyltransferase [Paraburkholderia sabiae]WJZ77305.1 RiPP maturation radical SAM C-methyltransferase [Paraburkholderia sabiae]CAD6547999.1 hypothetical protein LMG24235_04515 [Paraburkholderia sabiae]
MSERPDTRQPRVLLVSPPWTSLNEPSLGLALLSAILKREGIAVRVTHLNLFTLDFLRAQTYGALARIYALDDFLFSGLLDPEVTPRQLRLLREKCAEVVSVGTIDHRQHGGIAGIVAKVLQLRAEVIPAWVDTHVARMVQWCPTLVGFTCMFDQTIASVAIASRLRRAAPGIMTVLGGYAVRAPTGEMLLDAFPWIDAICTGEGEPCIAALARVSVNTEPDLSAVPNLLYRNGAGRPVESPQAGRVDMDTVPPPDFDDFYAEVAELSAAHSVDISVDRLPVENSRGCWWGATHHCVFCGIHDDDMAYRARSAESVLHTLDWLSHRYGCNEFRFADYILPHAYYNTLLPRLIERGAPYRLKCELKANIDARRMRLLVDAGFVEVQPGIESFSNRVLTSMDKGVSGVQNVYLLLLARRYGLTLLYNLLYGLPDDDADTLEAIARALPHLAHLDPPSTRGRIQITRYAPLQADPARFGLGELRHEPAYDLIFSGDYLAGSGFDLDRYCYIFRLPFEPSPRLARIYREIEALCDAWTAEDRRRPMDLLYECDEAGRLIVSDSRREPMERHALSADESRLLLAAETPTTRPALSAMLPMTDDELGVTLRALATRGLIFEDGGKLVSLALPMNGVAPRRHWWDHYATRWRPVAEHEPGTPSAVDVPYAWHEGR